MPKDMFNHIPKEKQEMFLNVAIKEFTTKSFEKVSVNSIIKSARISRGSFYTYFENKEELFNYIFKQVREKRFSHAKDIIKESNRDFFVFVKRLFEYDFENFSTENKYSLFRNYIHYIQVNKKGSIKDSIILPLSTNSKEKEDKFSNLFDIKDYKINDLEFLDLVEMTMILVVNTFIKFETENLSKEEVLKIFNSRIEILQHGSRKRVI